MADFVVIVDSTSRRVLKGGNGRFTAGAGESGPIPINKLDLTQGLELTDHEVSAVGVVTLNTKTEPGVTFPATATDWVSKQDRIIALSDDAGNFQEEGIIIDNIHEDAQSMEIILVNKKADSSLTREISAVVEGSGDDYEWTVVRQTAVYAPNAPSEDEVFHIVLNGTDFSFEAPASPTVADIVAGLVLAINAGSEPVTAADTNPTVTTVADVKGVPFNATEVMFFDADLDGGALVDLTSVTALDDAVVSGQLFEGTGDFLYVGQREQFTDIDVIVGAVANDLGDLAIEYWNGATWTAVTGLVDGTDDGSGTLRQPTIAPPERITFDLPSDWSAGTHLNVPGLDRSILYFVRLSTEFAPGPPTPSRGILEYVDIVNESVTNQSTGSITAERTIADKNEIALKLKFETRSSLGTYDITFDPDSDLLHRVCTSGVLPDEKAVGVLVSDAFEVKDFTKSRWTRIEPTESPGNDIKVLFTADPTAIRDGFKVLLNPLEEKDFSADASGVAIASKYLVGKSTDGVIQPVKVTYTKAYITARTAPVGSACDVVIENIDDATSQTVSIADGTNFESGSISLAFDATEKLAIKFGSNVGLSSTAQDVSVILSGKIERPTGEGLVIVDPDEYTINFPSNPDEIESVTFSTAPKTGTRVFFDYAIYDNSEAKPATMSGIELTRRSIGHC